MRKQFSDYRLHQDNTKSILNCKRQKSLHFAQVVVLNLAGTIVCSKQRYSTMASPTLESLATTVYQKATELAQIASQNNVHASLENPASSELSSITPLTARNELIQAAKDLLYLAMGPTDHVLSLAWSVCESGNFQTVPGSFIQPIGSRHREY